MAVPDASADAAPASSPAPPWARAVIVLLLFLPSALAVHSLRQKSLTWDEPIYLGAGHFLAYTRNFHIAALTYHPPLAMYVNSVGLLSLDLPRSLFDPAGPAQDWQMGVTVAYHAGHRPDVVRTLARLPFACLFPLLGAIVYAWSRTLWGWRGGLLSLWLVAWCPNLLAHARLVATDFLFTVALVATLWSGRGLLQLGGWPRYLRTGVLAGLTCLTKFSAVALGPVLLVGAWFASRPSADGAWRNWSRRRVAAAAVGLLVLACVVIWIGYLGQVDVALADAQRKQAMRLMEAPEGLFARAAWALYQSDVKLPAMAFVTGFISQYFHSTVGHPSYLFGEISWTGHWYYFPVALAFKTPLPTLALWMAGGAAWILTRARGREAAWVFVAPAVLLLLAGRANINIGVRHVLPLFPLAAIAAGAVVRWWPKPAGRVLICAAGLALAVATVRAHPHYLAYFNVLGGGPDGGRRVLVDSNLDWGQDLDALYARAQSEGWLPMQVQYFGPLAVLDYAPPGITPLADPCTPTSGYVAVSVTNLMGVHVPGGTGCMRWLDAYEPVARINHTIWVYDIPDDA